jgi:hypothetical protein
LKTALKPTGFAANNGHAGVSATTEECKRPKGNNAFGPFVVCRAGFCWVKCRSNPAPAGLGWLGLLLLCFRKGLQGSVARQHGAQAAVKQHGLFCQPCVALVKTAVSHASIAGVMPSAGVTHNFHQRGALLLPLYGRKGRLGPCRSKVAAANKPAQKTVVGNACLIQQGRKPLRPVREQGAPHASHKHLRQWQRGQVSGFPGQTHIGRRVLPHEVAHDSAQGGDRMHVQMPVQMQPSPLPQW